MTTMDYAGVEVDLGADVLNADVRQALCLGGYEREETECVDLYLEEDDDVVELGGGIGYLACYVDQRLDDDRTHVVVEPNGHLVPLVERHRELNDATFDLLNAAYATDRSIVELSVPDAFWEASLRDANDADRTLHAGAVDLETILDTFDLSDIALVVDVEGSEVDLIENNLDLLESACRLLVVEYHYENAPHDLAEEIRWAKGALDTSDFELIDEKRTVSVYRSPRD